MPIKLAFILLIFSFTLFHCGENQQKTVASTKEEPSKVEEENISGKQLKPKIYENFEDMEHLFHMQNDTTYLINFWATWCKPCVKELPLFEKLLEDFGGGKYKSILVSLDFPNKIESKLIPFIENNKLKSEVIVLTDGKQQQWIDKVDKEWDGAIPVTLIYKKDKSKFLYGEVHDYLALKGEVEKIMSSN